MEIPTEHISLLTTVLAALLGGLASFFIFARNTGMKEALQESRLGAVEGKMIILESNMEKWQEKVCKEIQGLRRMLTTAEGGHKFITVTDHTISCAKANELISKDINNLGNAIRDLTHKIDTLEGKVDRFYIPFVPSNGGG